MSGRRVSGPTAGNGPKLSEVLRSSHSQSKSNFRHVGFCVPMSDSEIRHVGFCVPMSDSKIRHVGFCVPMSESEIRHVGFYVPMSDSEISTHRVSYPKLRLPNR